jgi:adenine phosphoribosyltransferase
MCIWRSGAQPAGVNPADLTSFVRDIPDFPRPGIVFKDITPLLLHPDALDTAVAALAARVSDLHVDFVVAAEARGFILGAALARELGAGLVPARRPTWWSISAPRSSAALFWWSSAFSRDAAGSRPIGSKP